MMDEELTPKSSRGSHSLNLPSALVLLWLLRRLRKRDGPDRPQIISLNPASKTVLEHAKRLAGEGREDAGAVAELRALANGRRRTLRQAERASRFMGYHRELRRANLTNRLLSAAVARDETPRAPTPSDGKRIDAIEAFKEMTGAEQWTLLLDAQPALHQLEADVRSGQFEALMALPDELLRRGTPSTHETIEGKRVTRVTRSSSDPPRTPEEKQRLMEYARAHMQLTSKLQLLVGPRSGHHDPVLASQQALEAAERHLKRLPTNEAGTPEVPST